jgi:hypothetical protein
VRRLSVSVSPLPAPDWLSGGGRSVAARAAPKGLAQIALSEAADRPPFGPPRLRIVRRCPAPPPPHGHRSSPPAMPSADRAAERHHGVATPRRLG